MLARTLLSTHRQTFYVLTVLRLRKTLGTLVMDSQKLSKTMKSSPVELRTESGLPRFYLRKMPCTEIFQQRSLYYILVLNYSIFNA